MGVTYRTRNASTMRWPSTSVCALRSRRNRMSAQGRRHRVPGLRTRRLLVRCRLLRTHRHMRGTAIHLWEGQRRGLTRDQQALSNRPFQCQRHLPIFTLSRETHRTCLSRSGRTSNRISCSQRASMYRCSNNCLLLNRTKL